MRRSVTLFLAAVLASCLRGEFTPLRADAAKPTYDDDVLPVFKLHCVGCHGNDKQKGGLNVATFAAVMEGGSSGAVVAPGDSGKSRLYSLTAHKEEPKMPPGSAAKVPDAQLALLSLWIDQGARENGGSKAIAVKPKADIGLPSVVKGRPPGPPPMPLAGKLSLDPVVHARRPGAALALAASPWAPLVAAGGAHQVLLFHADTGQLLGVLPFPHGQVNVVKFSRSGKLLLAAGGRGGASGKAVLFDVETGGVVAEVGNEADAVLAADLSADQTQVALGGPGKVVRVYSTADGALLREIKKHTDWVTAVEYSPDGVLLATGDRAGGLFAWEAFTGREFFTLKNPPSAVNDLAWRDDANVLASAGEDGAVRLWEMENGTQSKTWAAHGGGAAAVRFGHDGKLASTGRDKVVKLWDAGGALVKAFDPLPDLGLRVAVTHDDAKVVGGDWGGVIRAWGVADGKAAGAFDVNPLPLAERVRAAEAVLAAADAKAKAAADALRAAEARAKETADAHAAAAATAAKVAADLAAARKAFADHTGQATLTAPQVTAAKGEIDRLAPVAASAAAARNKAASLEVTAPAFTAAAKTIADAAAKAPGNPDLAAAAKAATATAAQQAADLPAALKAAADAEVVLKAAADRHAAVTKAVADYMILAAGDQKAVVALIPAAEQAASAVAPAKAAMEQAAAAVPPAKAAAGAAAAEATAARASLDPLRAAASLQPAAPKK